MQLSEKNAEVKLHVRSFLGGDRDVSARFTHGTIVGLGNLFRLGDCTHGFFGSQMKMGCNVALSNIRFLMNADVEVRIVERMF